MTRLGRGYPNNALLRGIPLAPPVYDAVGAGAAHGASISWSHTGAAGAYVLVPIAYSFSLAALSSVTYGGTPMPLLGSVHYDANPDALVLYGLANIPGGAQTVDVTFNTTAYCCANSISYTQALSAGNVQSITGSGAVLSQQVSCLPNQLAVQVFANASIGHGILSSFGGGVHRYYGYDGTGGYYRDGVSISDAVGGATFTAADSSSSDNWAALSVVLN